MSAVLDVKVTTLQRISAGRERARSYATKGHRHVPGSVVRGALAAVARAEGWFDTSEFRSVFDGEVRFGPLFADGSSLEPLSVVGCKYPTPDCPQEEDLAFTVVQGRKPDLRCPTCHSLREALKGEVVGADMVSLRSTAIDRDKGSAAESQLFQRDALQVGTRLTGQIIGDAARPLAGTHRVRLGGRTSVLGEAEMTITEGTATPWAPPESGRVALRLLSPAVLVDAAGRATPDLATALDQGRAPGRVLHVWQRTTTESTGGWHAASGLPKPADFAVAAGSTIVIEVETAGRNRITELLSHGIGLRRPEGFGWLVPVTTSWTRPHRSASVPPASVPPASVLPAAPGLAELREQVRQLGLSNRERRWLVARLRDDAPSDEAAAMTVLQQRGARTLTGERYQTVKALLLLQDPALRSGLRGSLIEEGNR